MLTEILQFDTEIFLYLNNLGTSTWDGFWLSYTEKITHLPMVLFLAFLLYKKLGLRNFLYSLIGIAIMITFTDQLTNLAKYSFKRPRPCRLEELQEVMRFIAKRCGPYGYFSGHSSNSMALAIFIGNLLNKYYKGILPVLICWAIGMGYSRIYIGVHYPLDLLTGFTVGAILGGSFYMVFKKYIQK